MENTVVGSNSIVTKEFLELNILLAGVPARIIRKNINWSL